MSFNEREVSTEGGKPIGLYWFKYQGAEWFYTSADRDIEYNGETYLAVSCSDEGVKQGSQDEFFMLLQADLPIPELYLGTPPSGRVRLFVRHLHEGDTEAPIIWGGTITDVTRPENGEAEVKIRCATVGNTASRVGVRLAWVKQCSAFLYDSACTVDPEAYRVNATVSSKTGNSITASEIGAQVSASDPDWFDGGYIAFEILPGVIERRVIERTDGSTVYLMGASDRIDVGMTVAAYPGCKRTMAVCDEKFDNHLNYRGIRHLIGKSPFDGSPLY